MRTALSIMLLVSILNVSTAQSDFAVEVSYSTGSMTDRSFTTEMREIWDATTVAYDARVQYHLRTSGILDWSTGLGYRFQSILENGDDTRVYSDYASLSLGFAMPVGIQEVFSIRPCVTHFVALSRPVEPQEVSFYTDFAIDLSYRPLDRLTLAVGGAVALTAVQRIEIARFTDVGTVDRFQAQHRYLSARVSITYRI